LLFGALFDTWVAVELAEQGIAVPTCPVGEVLDELLDLGAGRFFERTGAAVVHGISLDECRIELVLAYQLAQTVADPRAAIAIPSGLARLRWPPARLSQRFCIAITNSEFLDRAEADAVGFAECPVYRTGLGHAHLGATNEERDIRGVGITVADEARRTFDG
jgi:hypothetical protein